ncbi:predicted protein [Botrytis cinerea T4]|uniref:Uncharacterized protein n=1 Tax=Botryotinia fuckeliana (strain T4) TaxID=999810 RepID=G2YRL7_BOTF4|nr:predicted protein [Botrytis cinerea T4]
MNETIESEQAFKGNWKQNSAIIKFDTGKSPSYPISCTNTIKQNSAIIKFDTGESPSLSSEANDIDLAKPNSSSEYVKRGWTLDETWSTGLFQHLKISGGHRSIGDSQTWTIDLSRIRVNKREKKLPDALVECSHFGMGASKDEASNDECIFFKIYATCEFKKIKKN